MNIHHHHPEHLLPSSRTSSLASSIFPTPVRALLTLLQNVRISTILASAGSRLRQAVAGQCLQASLHSERGTRRLEQHLYITADCFACVVLAGVYFSATVLAHRLPDNLRQGRHGLLISGFGEGCAARTALDTIATAPKAMQRTSGPSAGRLREDLHLCDGLELQHKGREER